MKGNGRFLISWADLRYRQGDTLSSLSLMREAEQVFCDQVFSRNLALLYEMTGQTAEAEKALDRAVNMVPGGFNVAYERILFLQRIGKYRKAYDEAVKLYYRPVHSSYYVDPFIIKAKLRTFIQSRSPLTIQ
jgi:tetratricopeptide (TPR) repeat protein